MVDPRSKSVTCVVVVSVVVVSVVVVVVVWRLLWCGGGGVLVVLVCTMTFIFHRLQSNPSLCLRIEIDKLWDCYFL